MVFLFKELYVLGALVYEKTPCAWKIHAIQNTWNIFRNPLQVLEESLGVYCEGEIVDVEQSSR